MLDPAYINRRDLWDADAIHRTNNLRQMAMSLGSESVRRKLGVASEHHASEAGILLGAYSELAEASDMDCDVACEPLLETISTMLVALFGTTRSIRLHLSLEPIVLASERRRALILIASELIINALKYAFVDKQGGVVCVTAGQIGNRVNLIVADNGGGLRSVSTSGGTGTDLLCRLASLLSADVHRYSSSEGLSVVVLFPS